MFKLTTLVVIGTDFYTLFSPLFTGLVPRGSAALKPPAPQDESSEESEDEDMCFGLFEDYSYGRAFPKKFSYFSNARIQLGIGLRTVAHPFLKLSGRTL